MQLEYNWIWIDTCCVDKTSSAELSEAINSMYAWYQGASMCIAYLQDVPDPTSIGPQSEDSHTMIMFRSSRWFTRGWTLQELIAPRTVVFVSEGWIPIGSKATLSKVLEEITGIPSSVLLFDCAIEDISIAQRMSWAASRDTTRIEDRAYSLMGLFRVHMPTIYGEGKKAFLRLQEEIMKRSPDQTLFSWHINHDMTGPQSGLLAEDPKNFAYALCEPISLSVLSQASHTFLEALERDAGTIIDHTDIFMQSSDGSEDTRPTCLINSFPLKHHIPTFTMTSHAVLAHIPLLTIEYYDTHDRLESLSPSRIDAIAILSCRYSLVDDIRLFDSREIYVGLPLRLLNLETTPPMYAINPVPSGSRNPLARLAFTCAPHSSWWTSCVLKHRGNTRISVRWRDIYISHTDHDTLNPILSIPRLLKSRSHNNNTWFPYIPAWVRLKVVRQWGLRGTKNVSLPNWPDSIDDPINNEWRPSLQLSIASFDLDDYRKRPTQAPGLFHVYVVKHSGDRHGPRAGVVFGPLPAKFRELGQDMIPLSFWGGPEKTFGDGEFWVRLIVTSWSSAHPEVDIELGGEYCPKTSVVNRRSCLF